MVHRALSDPSVRDHAVRLLERHPKLAVLRLKLRPVRLCPHHFEDSLSKRVAAREQILQYKRVVLQL